jgi:hypothetical protein
VRCATASLTLSGALPLPSALRNDSSTQEVVSHGTLTGARPFLRAAYLDSSACCSGVREWNTDGASFYFGAVPAPPTCTANDSLSGPGGCSVSGYSGAVGTHTLAATADDVAGNQTVEQRTYTVLAWTLRGFYKPTDMSGVLNSVKNGATVPLKFQVFAGSNELTSTSYIQQPLFAKQISCDTSAPIDDLEMTATGGTSLRYDGTSGQFIFNWQTPKTAGVCYAVTVTTNDGSSLTASFKLK